MNPRSEIRNQKSDVRSPRSDVGGGAFRSGAAARLVASPVASHHLRPYRAFTLTEMMVAVLVLIVVIIATSKIFGTASQVTGMGQATADLLAEAAAIERQMRDDFAKLSRDGFFAIRNVSVRNDINQATNLNAPLLNPNLPANARIRADQIVFFANGVNGSQTFRLAQGSNHKGEGTVSRIYYGHAFQLRNGKPCHQISNTEVTAHDLGMGPVNLTNPLPAMNPAFPWYFNNAVTPMVGIKFATGGSGGIDIFGAGAQPNPPLGNINASQPPATQWLLARQPVALVDDDLDFDNDNSKTDYLGQVTAARSIFLVGGSTTIWGWSREIRNGRLDAAASLPDEIRAWITRNPVTGVTRPWSNNTALDQRALISGNGPSGNPNPQFGSALYYPRAERRAPSAHRVDQALTNHVISGACSSVIFDWTYENGSGAVLNGLGNPAIVDPDGFPNNGDEYPLAGMTIIYRDEQPWFGMQDDKRGVFPYNQWGPTLWPNPNAVTVPGNFPPFNTPGHIEEYPTPNPANPIEVYEALFGYNQDRPLDPSAATFANPLGLPWATNSPDAYTPWPTAIRVTLTLHDPEGKLEAGREFQFVIDLPKRGR